jgi:hypothetical protein
LVVSSAYRNETNNESLVPAIEKIDANQENTDDNLRKMKDEMRTNQEKIDSNQEKMEARMNASNEKFEVLPGTVVSWMDIHQARTMSTQLDMTTEMAIHQENMEAAIHSV